MRAAACVLFLATAGCSPSVGAAIVADAGTTEGDSEPTSTIAAVDPTSTGEGLETTTSAEPTAGGGDGPPGFSLLLEAEQALLADPMEIAVDPEASGGEYVSVPGIGGRYRDAEALFAIEIPATGHYKLWPRVYADHLGSNSFTLELDGAVIKENWTWAVRSQWHIEGDVEVQLVEGAHEIVVRGREAGTRLDYLVVASAQDEPPPEP
ncbi:MAG: hypothetical protein AAGF11_38165 [Myxococcota bacterium]